MTLKQLILLLGLNLAEDLGTEVLDQAAIEDSLVAEPAEENPDAGAEPAEEAEELPLEAGAEETAQEEDDADWLPSEQERVWPDETLERFAQGRYPELLK